VPREHEENYSIKRIINVGRFLTGMKWVSGAFRHSDMPVLNRIIRARPEERSAGRS
jgi:hypothetical protein